MDSVISNGRSLVQKAMRINSGARHLIADGGTPDMLDKCRLEMDLIVCEHRQLVLEHELVFLGLLKKVVS